MNRRVHALIVAGAVGAGVHAAIAPEHLREMPLLGVAFAAAAVLFAVAVAALALRPDDPRAALAVAALLAAVVTGYVTSRVAALEDWDALGVGTSAVEAAGLLLALPLTLTSGGHR
jgi:hypothetical protein